MQYAIQRDKDGVAHMVGISGGKDSTCLALALKEKEPRPYNYFYTPTGDELPEMVAHLEYIEKLLGQPILRISNGSLLSIIDREKMIPNFRSRFCTRILKLIPAGRLFTALSAEGPVISYVGIRDDEDEREGTRPGGSSSDAAAPVTHVFPFQRWGWDIDDVWAFLDERVIRIPDRTDCALCYYQKLGEWWNLWNFYPDIFQVGVDLETKYGHTFRSASRDTWPASLADLRALFEAGKKPEISLRMMEKRRGMCRACSL